MADACPNIASSDWKALVDKFGKDKAYGLFIGNDHEIPLLDSNGNLMKPVVEYGNVEKLKSFTELKFKALSALAVKVKMSKSSKSETTKKRVQDAYNALDQVNSIIDFSKFADDAKDMLEIITKEIQDASILAESDNLSTDDIIKGMTKQRSIDDLIKANSYASGYDVVNDIIDYIATFEKDAPHLKELNDKLIHLSGMIGTVHINYRAKVKDKLVSTLALHSTKVRDDYRQKFEKQYKIDNPLSSFRTPEGYRDNMNDWVNNKLANVSAEIMVKEKEHIKTLLSFTQFDIHTVDFMLADARGTNDHLLQLATAILDKSDLKVTQEYIEDRDAFLDIYDAWKASRPVDLIYNPEVIYDKFLERDKDGNLTQRLKSLYTQEYLDALAQKKKDIQELTKNVVEINKIPDLQERANALSVNVAKINMINDKFFKTYRNYTSGESVVKPKYIANHGFTKEEQALYDAMINMQDKTDALLPQGSSRFGRKLPSVEKELGARLLNNNIKDLPKTLVSQQFTVRENDSELKASNILQDERGIRLKKVAVFYKGEIDAKDQSYDLPAILLAGLYSAKNYQEKNTIVPTLEVLREFFETRKYGEKTLTGAQATRKDPVTGELKPVDNDGLLSNATKRLDSLLKTRLYQIPEDNYQRFGVSVNKVVSSITSVAADQMLKWNYVGGLTNLVQGYTSNWIGTLSGKFFSVRDYNEAQLAYWKDITSIVSDIGSIRPKSLNNMLIEHFNVNTSLSSVNEYFSRDEAHLKMLGGIADIGGSFYSAPEHFLLSTIVQANLNSMLVVNKDGEFLTKDGGVTTDKKLAMNMVDAYSIVNGKLKLDPRVHNISNPRLAGKNMDKSIENISSVIKSSLAAIQGEYDIKNRAHIQREWWGKAVMFMRNWLYRGFQSRLGSWQNVMATDYTDIDLELRHYEQSGFRFKEGSYITAIRMIRGIYREVKSAETLLSIVPSSKGVYHGMTEMEQQNIKTFVTELSAMVAFTVAGMLVASLAKGDPDDPRDDSTALSLLAFILKRNQADLLFFTGSSMSDNIRVLDSPTYLSVTLKQSSKVLGLALGELFEMFTGDFEFDRYVRGEHKNEAKLKVLALKQIAFYKNMWNVDIKEKLKFIMKGS